MDGPHRVGMGRWLSAAGHPGRRDFMIAAALLVLPWVLGWAVAPHHHLDATAVTILDTLATRGNLAYFTGEAGDAAAARDQYAALLPL